jgi:hypothetical protein
MNSRLTSKLINEIWDRNSIFFDDVIGASREDFEIFMEGQDYETNIKGIINHFSYLQKNNSTFFEDNDYSWCFDPTSYRLPAEAVFQFRLIVLLIQLYKNELLNQTFRKCEPIVVREVIISGTSVQPKTIHREGLAFILFPLGWFEHSHFSCHGMHLIRMDNKSGFRDTLLGWCSKILAEEAINKFQEDHSDWSLEPALFTLLGLEISKFIIQTDINFSKAISEINEDNISDFGQLVSYACESFVLAHEAAHILVDDHKRAAFEADEMDADNLAFKLLTLSKDTILINGDVGVSLDALPVFAAQSFIFIGNASLQAQVELKTVDSIQYDKFYERSLAIQKAVKTIYLAPADITRLNNFSSIMRLYLQYSKVILQEILLIKDRTIDLAYARISDLTVN